jgi:hypothetical protein
MDIPLGSKKYSTLNILFNLSIKSEITSRLENQFRTGSELEPNYLEPVPVVLVLVLKNLGTEPRFRFQVLKNREKNRTEPNSATLNDALTFVA